MARTARIGVSCAPMPLALAPDAGLVLDALEAARLHFRLEMDAVMHDIRGSLRGRDPRQLVGGECVRHLELRQRFLELAAAQAAYAEAELARVQNTGRAFRRQRIAA
jgi:hypothetical protein